MATTTAKTPEQYIRQLEEPRRGEVRRLHELIRRTAPKLEPYMESGMTATAATTIGRVRGARG